MSLIVDILKASHTHLEQRRAAKPLAELKAMARDAGRARTTFRDAIERSRFSVIAEVKRRSPSGGDMDAENVRRALSVYDSSASVSAISILTDERYFGNSIADLAKARASTGKPLLRKDFIVDEYQVWEARAYGADAVLLMAGVLTARDPSLLRSLFDLASSLEMDVLFEIGMTEEPVAKQAANVPREAPIWGVNSRVFNTSRFKVRATIGSVIGKDLSTNPATHRELIDVIPAGKTVIAESGVHDPAAVNELIDLGYRAALIGTAFLKAGVQIDKAVLAFDREIAAPTRVSPSSVSTVTRLRPT
jgi:indole-3-glycerol phosphate synthase